MTKVKLQKFEPRKLDFERWKHARNWPAGSVDYDDGIELLTYLLVLDRAYSIAELGVMAQARFVLSRHRRIKTQQMMHLSRIHKTWSLKEQARRLQQGVPEESDSQDAPETTETGADDVQDVSGASPVVGASADVLGQVAQLQAEEDAMAVKRKPGQKAKVRDAEKA